MPPCSRVPLSMLMLTIVVLACNGSDTVEPTGSVLEVTTVTSGNEPDSDGYTLLIDGKDAGPVTPSGTVRLTTLSPGDHRLELNGVAANCRLNRSGPSTVTVTKDDTTQVVFTIPCHASAGAVQVTATTTGPAPDPDGYRVVVDGDSTEVVMANSSVTIGGIHNGKHTIGLNGAADNCTVGAPNPTSIVVTHGATANVTFAVTCVAMSEPGITVRVTTTGSSIDSNGYRVVLYGEATAPQSVAVNGSVRFTDPIPGEQAVALSGIADNCAVEGDDPYLFTYNKGDAVAVEFAVHCQTPVSTSWPRMTSGTGVTLTDISGTATDNIFAVGSGTEPNCESFCGRMTILHYNGTTWTTQLTTPGSAIDVWAGSATNALALGSSASLFLQYNGTTWSPMSAPAIDFGTAGGGFAALWGSSSSDVFAVGSISDASGSEQGYIAHFDGTAWSRMDIPVIPGMTASDVWGTSTSNVYMVGKTSGDASPIPHGIVLHYDGQQWSKVLDEPHLMLGHVWGTGPSEIYATGVTTGPDPFGHEVAVHGAIRRFDGSTWSKTPSPTGGELGAMGGASSNLYVLGSYNSHAISHFDGTAWTQFLIGDNQLTDIWTAPSGEVFAVGDGGAILRQP